MSRAEFRPVHKTLVIPYRCLLSPLLHTNLHAYCPVTAPTLSSCVLSPETRPTQRLDSLASAPQNSNMRAILHLLGASETLNGPCTLVSSSHSTDLTRPAHDVHTDICKDVRRSSHTRPLSVVDDGNHCSAPDDFPAKDNFTNTIVGVVQGL